MLVGTVFDTLVKYHLAKDLGLAEQPWEFPNVPGAFQAGKHVFDTYVESGAYIALKCRLELASDIQMEVKHTCDLAGGCIIGGLPDLYYKSKGGIPVILDFKVNGYYANRTTSPIKGWMKLYSEKENEWYCQQYHSSVTPVKIGDIEVNGSYGFEEVYMDWAIQLNMYGWIMGHDDFVTQVEQIVAKPGDCRPTLRVAGHSTISSRCFKNHLKEELCQVWDIIHSDHFFRDLSLEESVARCQLLDQRAKARQMPNVLTVVNLKEMRC
jgi:hypothetical protein